jgi:hypothetical protein
MVFCSECGHNVGTAKFCPECGAKTGAGGGAAPAPKKANPKPVPASSTSGLDPPEPSVANGGSWQIFDGQFKSQNPLASGDSLSGLLDALDDSTPNWVLYQYNEQYLVRLKWRPSGCGGMAKVKANQSEQAFLNWAGDRTKVTLEVLGKANLTDDNIWECIRPGSGTKVIEE